MRTGISIAITASDRARLEALVAARGSPQKHVWRARIVLLTADGVGTVAIMAATGKSKTCVWRWQERFMAEGVDGLLCDKTRPPGIAPLAPALVDKVVGLTLTPPDHEATHWTVRAMAGLSEILCARRYRHQMTNRSPKITANWVFASAHSRGGGSIPGLRC